MMGTCLRVKAGVSTARYPKMSDGSTQTEVLGKEFVVQPSDCDKSPGLPPVAQASTCKRRKHCKGL